jgi:putative hydrolase of the HAD superfamily
VAVRRLRPRAVLLDALGTLVRLEPPAPRLQAELKTRFGRDISLAQAEQAIAAEISYYRAHLDQGRDQRGLDALRARCAQILFGELQPSLGGEVRAVQTMVDVLMASLRFTAFPDTGPALSQLRRLELRLVVVSNWDVSLPGVLAGLGLNAWLDGVVTSAEVGAGKPDGAIFERALEIAGVGPSEAVHVGDSLREDIQGARAAGIEPVLITRGASAGRSGPDELLTIGSLSELPPLVSALDGRRASDLI